MSDDMTWWTLIGLASLSTIVAVASVVFLCSAAKISWPRLPEDNDQSVPPFA